MYSSTLLILLALPFVSSIQLSKGCRDLLTCAISRKCVNLNYLKQRFTGMTTITSAMYDDLAIAIDYGCIFNSGCNTECNSCNLCMNSKIQLTEVLSGENTSGECSSLVNCATECIAKAGAVSEKIYACFLHGCAYHCFNGSCSKCSQFTTRVFNQACVSGELRKAVSFNGQCQDLFRSIVYQKFRPQFDGIGRQPSIGLH